VTMDNLIKKAKQFAKSDSTIHISGESGCGKELMAQAIHNASKRRNEAFVPINFAALSATLSEAELFGYVEGAFTGAKKGGDKGLFELAGIPYVGCGVLASAVSMDKLYTKIIVDTLGISQARYVGVYKDEINDVSVYEKIEETLGYPVFVKPSNAGSSRGVSKAANREELIAGLKEAANHDRKILVEETIYGRELECAVLGDGEVAASGIGEVLAAAEFYDYEAKYHNAESQTVISPKLPEGKEEEIREAAVKIFKAVDGQGLSRVDFFLEKETNRVIFNEINTLPGFTSISMYPMLWGARGIDKPALISRLLELAHVREINV